MVERRASARGNLDGTREACGSLHSLFIQRQSLRATVHMLKLVGWAAAGPGRRHRLLVLFKQSFYPPGKVFENRFADGTSLMCFASYPDQNFNRYQKAQAGTVCINTRVDDGGTAWCGWSSPSSYAQKDGVLQHSILALFRTWSSEDSDSDPAFTLAASSSLARFRRRGGKADSSG